MARDDASAPPRGGAGPAGQGTRIRQIADLLDVPVEALFEVGTHPLYTSPNGDRWTLTRSAAGAAVVRHVGNAASGGHVTELGVEAFLDRDRGSPQRVALMRLVEGLVVAFLSDAGRADGTG